jgi:hypothetical protein
MKSDILSPEYVLGYVIHCVANLTEEKPYVPY